MDIYTLERIKNRYPVDLDSGYSPARDKYTDSLFQWPGNKYFNPWDRERQILLSAGLLNYTREKTQKNK